jgi:ribosome-associated translation inhibitor RaiA
MKVQVNTSNDIDNKDALERWASDYLNEHLGRFDQDITSIEVQMTDENHVAKGGNADKRCMLEARVNGIKPIAVTNYAANQDLAFRGASDKLAKALDHEFGKLDRREHRQRDTIRRDPEVLDTIEDAPPQS